MLDRLTVFARLTNINLLCQDVQKLKDRHLVSGRLGLDEEYRMPTEAEWERAARAGNPDGWTEGDDPRVLAQSAWFDLIGQDGPKPVAGRAPNAWGF